MRPWIGVTLCTLIVAGCASTKPPASAPSTASAPTNPDGSTNPLYALTLMRQGSVLLQQERFQDALRKFEEADRHAPGNATVFNMMGLCHLRLGQNEEALTDFNQALRLIPSFTDARNNRGAAYLAMGQYRLAEVDFAAVLADTTYPHRWDVYYNLAMTYLERGQLAAAEDNFRRAVTAPSPVFEAFLRLSEIKQLQGEPDAAIDLLEEARLKYPDRMEASLALGRLLILLDREEEASPYLNEVIMANPGSALAREAERLLGTG